MFNHRVPIDLRTAALSAWKRGVLALFVTLVAAVCGDGSAPIAPAEAPSGDRMWDGEWHLLRWHMKMSSHESANDGTIEAWLDGVKFLESFGISTNSPPEAYFRYMALGRNGDPVEASSIYWGQVSIHTSNPGW